jgi:fructosamine-3-kinase
VQHSALIRDPQVSLGVAQRVARLITMGHLNLKTPPNQQSQIGLQLQPVHLTGAQRRMGLSVLNVVNQATELRIVVREQVKGLECATFDTY